MSEKVDWYFEVWWKWTIGSSFLEVTLKIKKDKKWNDRGGPAIDDSILNGPFLGYRTQN